MWKYKSAIVIRIQIRIQKSSGKVKRLSQFPLAVEGWTNWQAILETPKSFTILVRFHLIWNIFSQFKNVSYVIVQSKLGWCQKQEILRRNRPWIYVRCFSSFFFFFSLSFLDTQNPYAHTYINIYNICRYWWNSVSWKRRKMSWRIHISPSRFVLLSLKCGLQSWNS